MKNIQIVLLVVVLAACLVAGVPSIPELYHGYATINGVLAPNGTFVEVQVNGTNESVGNTTIDALDGSYTLQVYFDDTETNETDEGADGGDLLVWYVNSSQADRPEPATDTASSGTINDLFVVSVGTTPVKIVDYSPSNTAPTMNENSSLMFTVTAIGPVDQNLTYNWTVDGETQSTGLSFTYTSSVGENGTKNVTFEVSNDTHSDTQSWDLTINIVPAITPAVPNITTESNTITDFNLTPYESDYEDAGSDLSWGVSGDEQLIATVSIDNDILTVIPRPNVAAIDYVTLTLTDSDGGTDTQEIAIIIEPKCSGIDPPASGVWNITTNTTCEDTSINLSEGDDAVINSSVYLVLDNTTVILDEDQSGDAVLWVDGVLELVDSIFKWL